MSLYPHAAVHGFGPTPSSFGAAEPLCRDGIWSWLPYVGCNWQAGAKEAARAAKAYGADWMLGVKTLIRTGQKDGLGAALSQASEAALYASASAASWSVEQVQDLLTLVDDRLVYLAAAQARNDAYALSLPGTGASILAQARDATYQAALSQARSAFDRLSQLTQSLSGWASSWKQTFSGAPVLPAGALPLAAIAATALVLYKLADFLLAREETALARMLAEQPPAEQRRMIEMLEKRREDDPSGRWADAIPWVAGVAGLGIAAKILYDTGLIRGA